MEITGWGRYPVVETESLRPRSPTDLDKCLSASFCGIARGMGRSYGDSSLAGQTVDTRYLNHQLAFDVDTGVLHCQAGVTLAEILQIHAPRGWFLPVSPGTKFVTAGGAVASDVHGKNHHGVGSFGDHVEGIRVMLAGGEILECTRQAHLPLFRATCGGMGLTGVILEVALRLKPITSAYVRETTLKAKCLEEALDLFAIHEAATYSVAWIDCLSAGRGLGRSLVFLGEHEEAGALATRPRRALAVPLDMPSFVLDGRAMKIFNALFYNRVRQARSERRVHYDPYFYPLDSIQNWNRLYGKRGFIQYQLVVPRDAGKAALTAILKRIVAAGRGSFLAVLKAFGKANDNPLSFPMEGYTVALDFQLDRQVLDLLQILDSIVLDHGGRLYLTKDARMSEKTFKRGYPHWEAFQEIRARYGALETFRSHQSTRLGL